METSPLTILALLTAEFERLGVTYLVGGSVASSIYGIPRTTRDVDFVADLAANNVLPLVDALQADCYIDAEMIYDAIATRSSFNILHLATMHKADIFVMKSDRWSGQQMERRVENVININGQDITIQLASPEDMILQKLAWFRLGGGVSKYQLPDVVGMLKVQADRLDFDYLRHWAQELGLTELLQEAYEDAGLA